MSCEEKIFELLSKSGCKGTFICYPTGKAPELPWFVYKLTRKNLYANNDTYFTSYQVTVDFYTKELGTTQEQSLESVIDNYTPYAKTETWLTSEDCYVVSFTFTYLDTD